MRRFVLSILISAILVTLVTGCGGAHRYDARLVAADSLMLPARDSALAVVEGITDTMLRSERDLAYRDLLLTQARYKCYAEITTADDSAITRAMDYFSSHNGDREKLTRATLYKGAVMEELGQVDSAIFYYKTTEMIADPTDYFTLGYVNLRMGALYRDHFSIDGKDIEKYELAHKYLMQTKDKHYQLVCKINLGALYRLNKPEESETMLREAMALAKELQDTSNYIASAQNLIILYDYYGKYHKAKALIDHVMQYPHNRIKNLCFTSSASVYAKLGMPDSAEYLLQQVNSESLRNPIDHLSLLECLGAIALARRDSLGHLQYEYRCKQITDSLKANQETVDIIISEHEFDLLEKKSLKNAHRKTTSWLIGGSLFILLLLSLIYYRRLHRYDKITAELKLTATEQMDDLAVLKKNIEKLKIQDKQLMGFISSHLNLTKEMIEACYHSPNSKLTEKVRKIVEFQQDNKNEWTQLYHYIDAEYNGIIHKTRNDYSQLNDKDLLLIALTCTGFSYIQIAIIMGYTNATSIGTIKQRLARKMNLDGTLNDYINSVVKS